jgi:hypothetical protein
VQGAVLRQIAKTGVIPDNYAELAREMAAPLCQDKFGYEPDPSRLERFLSKLLSPAHDPL